MHNPESIPENEIPKFPWDFEMKTDNLISARQPDQSDSQQNDENLPNSGLHRPVKPQNKIQRKRKER